VNADVANSVIHLDAQRNYLKNSGISGKNTVAVSTASRDVTYNSVRTLGTDTGAGAKCSGDYDSYSDEPEGSHDYDECLDEDCDLCNAGLPAPRNPDWPPGRGIEIQVNFTSESLTVSEWIIHKENGDLVRESSLPPNTLGEVPAVYAVDSTGREILIQPEDLNRS